ncbi:MAG: hypothetical protein ACR2KZ_12285, partial [Segetibacter sp.]
MRIIKKALFKKTAKLSILFILAITNLSGQDNPHQKNVEWLQQQKQIAASTVLLNNEQGFVP